MDKQRFTNGYIALTFLLMVLYGVSSQAIGTLITRIIGHYGIRMAQAGLLSSFYSAGCFAAIFVITIFAGRRINKVLLMGGSLFFFALSLGLISSAPPFAVILACFALLGISAATTDTLANSLVADIMPDNISRNMSLLHGFFGLGGLCGPIIMERIAFAFNWTQLYLIVSLAFFTYLLIYAAFVRWQWDLLSIRIQYEKQTRFGFADITLFFTKKRHVLLWITMFFYVGNQGTLSVWIKRYVEIYLNEPAWGAYTLSAMWLGTSICRLFISPAIKASSPMKIFVGNLVSAIAVAAGLLSGSAPGIAAASLAVGLSSGLTIPLILAMGCEWNPDKTVYGTMMPFTAGFIANVIFPPLSGLVSDLLGIPWGIALGGMNALIAVVFSGILGAVLKSESRSIPAET